MKGIIPIIAVFILSGCATGYQMIDPKTINYISQNSTEEIMLEYKYDVLSKKYAKKEKKRGIKVASLKITNNSDRDLVFGRDIRLAYENGTVR